MAGSTRFIFGLVAAAMLGCAMLAYSEYQSQRGIDLQQYFPKSYAKIRFVKWSGEFSQEYRFSPGDSFFQTIYNDHQTLNTPGSLLVWEKRANDGSAGPDQLDGNCLETYGMLWMGADKSITEVGDWFSMAHQCKPSLVFGYRDARTDQNGGLRWSGPGGLSTSGITSVVWPKIQGFAGGPLNSSSWLAYSYSALVGVLPTFTLDYGRDESGKWVKGAGRTYQNVAQIVFWHGVKDTGDPSFKTPNCATDPTWPYRNWYHSKPGFKSYAFLFYLAPGEGPVRMDFLFNETDNYFPPEMTCKGLALGNSATSPRVGNWDYGPNWIEYADR